MVRMWNEAPAKVTTWVWRGGAPVAAERRRLKGVHHVAIGDGRQVVFVWKGALKARWVQLCEDDLWGGETQQHCHPLCLQTQRKQSSKNNLNRFDPTEDLKFTSEMEPKWDQISGQSLNCVKTQIIRTGCCFFPSSRDGNQSTELYLILEMQEN